MKKKLILKLIESNDTPTIGDIVSRGHAFRLLTKGFTMPNEIVIKPIIISDEEIKDCMFLAEVNNGYKISYHIYDTKNNEPMTQDKKIEVTSEQIPTNILQAIVEGKLKDSSELELEYDTEWIPFDVDSLGQTRSYAKYSLKLDSNNKAIVSIPESNSFKVVSKEELENRRSSAYEYANIESNTPMYSEEEVKELCELAAIYGADNSYTHHYDDYDSDREFTDDYDFEKWFNENKKKQ